MTPKRHYPNAPITEALIDFQVDTSAIENQLILDSINKELKDLLKEDYPFCEELYAVEGQLQFGPNPSASATQTLMGYKFTTADKKQIFQARLNGFTISKLKPYCTWKQLRDEAERLWKTYKNAVSFEYINRVAVRYINRIDLPLPLKDFKDYLRTLPEVSPDLPQALSGYFMQIQIPYEDIKSTLLLNEALLPMETEDKISVLLDIDIFSLVKILGDGEEHWQLLEQLRMKKNDVFEACITDATRELFR